MLKKIIISAILILVAITFIYIQWNEDIKTLNRIEEGAEIQLKINIINFNHLLNSISETLDLYDDGFTDTDRNLFLHAVRKDVGSLSQYAQNLGHISNMIEIEDVLKYQSYIWKLQSILNDIYEGEITDKSDIDSISETINRNCYKIADILLNNGVSVEQLKVIFEQVNSLNIEIDELLEH